MPAGVYNRYICSQDDRPEFEPNAHQAETLQYFLRSPFKGLLLYHKLGSGKTCTAILIADEFLRRELVGHVYILSPGSLRDGWVKEYCKICGKDSDTLRDNYTFVTYNFAVGGHLPDFNNSLVIIDEAHNLINGVSHKSKTAVKIYNALLQAKCRILALTGTPIYNKVEEFPLLGRLLKPGPIFASDLDDKNSDFMRRLVKKKDGTIEPLNPINFLRQLEGIVSYYPGSTSIEDMPKIIEMPPFKLLMSPPQEYNYWVNVVRERRLSNPPDEKMSKQLGASFSILKQLYIMARRHILSRSAANFNYPKEAEDEPDTMAYEGGWIKPGVFDNGLLLTNYSTKMAALFVNLTAHDKQKHVVFTSLKEKSGAKLIHSMLRLCKIRSEVFSGDLDDAKRRQLLKTFNSEANRYGDIIRVLIVTEAGAEGISILEARHMHILESAPKMSKILQVIGRVARFRSHSGLPENERNVKIWRYWSIASPEPVTVKFKMLTFEGKEQEIEVTIKKKDTIDQKLHEKGLMEVRNINSFLDWLQRASVTSYESFKSNYKPPQQEIVYTDQYPLVQEHSFTRTKSKKGKKNVKLEDKNLPEELRGADEEELAPKPVEEEDEEDEGIEEVVIKKTSIPDDEDTTDDDEPLQKKWAKKKIVPGKSTEDEEEKEEIEVEEEIEKENEEEEEEEIEVEEEDGEASDDDL